MPSRRYCSLTTNPSGPRNPSPCHRTLAASTSSIFGNRSNSIGSRIVPTVRRERWAPAQWLGAQRVVFAVFEQVLVATGRR